MNYLLKEIHLFKMVLTLFTCILIFVLLGETNYDIILIACYASIFGVQAKTTNIAMYGVHRLFGTLVGGIVVLVYIYMYHQLSKVIPAHYGLLFLPAFIWFASILVGGFQNKSATVMGVTLTMVTMGLLVLESNQLHYLKERMFATVIGVLSSIVVNLVVHFFQKRQYHK